VHPFVRRIGRRVAARPRSVRGARRSRAQTVLVLVSLVGTLLGASASLVLADTTLVLSPVADAQVGSSNPTANYGSLTSLKIREGTGDATSPNYRTYMKFVVAGLGGPVTAATLRLYVTDPSTDGGSIYATDAGWSEGTITYANAPAIGGTPVGAAGAVALGTYVDVAIAPSAVAGDGTYSFALKSAKTDSAIYVSREGAQPPQLVLTVGAAPPPPAPPVADFSASPTSGPAPLTTSFADRSTGTPTAWSWDFGDPGSGAANTSPLQNPSHTYAASGTYTVSMTASNSLGANTKTASGLISVSAPPPPPASLTFGPTDDAYVSSSSPAKNYGANTSLRVREGTGASNSPIYRSYLRFNVSGVGAPVTSAKLRLFTTDASVDGGGVYAVDASWTERGITFANAPPLPAGPIAPTARTTLNAYREIDLGAAAIPGNGVYAFALRSASTDSAVYAAKESSNPKPQLVLTLGPNTLPPPPTADFTGTPTAGRAPLTIAFSDASTGSPTSWSWDFGDGATSSVPSPTHIYVASGSYTVTLRVTNAGGLGTKTRPAYISVDVPAPTPPGDPVLVGAGDIADCNLTSDDATATVIDGIAGTVFAAGDNAYEAGTAAEYANCYDPTWGRAKSRTLPVAGNHDYETPGAAGYFGYFGAAAGDPTKGWYSTDVGAWHVVVLNSNCSDVGGCSAGSAQEVWLKADLAAHPTSCTVAIWHHPRFSSGTEGTTASAAFWQDLYDANVDVVVNGHEHFYERYGPQDPTGSADAARGIREFIVGTGGRTLRGLATIAPNSEIRNTDTFGVIKLTLHAASFDWAFVPIAGQTFTDRGTGNCH
jgi:PKD repeat protein